MLFLKKQTSEEPDMKNKLFVRKRVMTILCVAALAMTGTFMTGCGDSDSSSSLEKSSSDEISSSSSAVDDDYDYSQTDDEEDGDYGVIDVSDLFDMTEEDHIESDENGNQYITGTIKNVSDAPLDGVWIYFNMYDSDGNDLGQASACAVDIIGSGETWTYQAIILDENIDSYEFDGITASAD